MQPSALPLKDLEDPPRAALGRSSTAPSPTAERTRTPTVSRTTGTASADGRAEAEEETGRRLPGPGSHGVWCRPTVARQTGRVVPPRLLELTTRLAAASSTAKTS